MVLMRPVLAYRIQEAMCGAGSKLAANQLQKNGSPDVAKPRFKQGTRIVREGKGEVHEVAVTSDGYEYGGEIYKSLSPTANCIIGTRWSGRRLWHQAAGAPEVTESNPSLVRAVP
jgi:hypothetical protein